jgi:hypothetical protein
LVIPYLSNVSKKSSGHVIVPKAWIGKEAIVTLKEKENRSKSKK